MFPSRNSVYSNTIVLEPKGKDQWEGLYEGNIEALESALTNLSGPFQLRGIGGVWEYFRTAANKTLSQYPIEHGDDGLQNPFEASCLS
jgi:hypothetical protein